MRKVRMNCKITGNENGMKRLANTALLLVLLFLAAGCAGTKGAAVAFDYYTLEYDTALKKEVPPEKMLPVVLRVDRFAAAPEYETDRMVYRDATNRRSVYYYHKWRAVPADLVTFFLRRDLAESGWFAGVLGPESGSANTHVLDGTVEEFLEWDNETSCEAVITVNVALLDPRETDATKHVLLQQRFTARKECEARRPVFVARAMSGAMAQLSLEIGAALHEVLQNNIPN